MAAFRLHFVGLYVALGNEFEFAFFRGLGCRCGGRCEKIAANAKLGCAADRNRVGSAGRLFVWNVWAAAAAATAAAAAGQIARTKYLMLIFVKSKMSLRANLANKSANYKCPKIDEQARRVTSQLLSRGADPTGNIKYIHTNICMSVFNANFSIKLRRH